MSPSSYAAGDLLQVFHVCPWRRATVVARGHSNALGGFWPGVDTVDVIALRLIDTDGLGYMSTGPFDLLIPVASSPWLRPYDADAPTHWAAS